MELMDALGDRRVYWVNVHVPTRYWHDEMNAVLVSLDAKYDNLSIIDWYSYSKDHPDWFVSDLVHPNREGAKGYVQLIGGTITG